jgi:general secretion pathway protein A
MYTRYFGLRERPFELTSNPKYLYLTPQHREALANLEYGLSTAKAITVVVGEAGTGKTTLLRAALQSERCQHIKPIVCDNPALSRGEFIEFIATCLQLPAEAGTSKASFLSALEPELRDRRARSQFTALIVDEAQCLSHELLEEIRLLANIETPSEKLLPLVLAGQPELGERLNAPELRQLKQRVALRCEIAPLSLTDTAAYIVARIQMAGGTTTKLFTREAVTLIHTASHGIPRTINVLCDNALISGFALGRRPVGREVVAEVCRDFDLPVADGAPAVQGIQEPRVPARLDRLPRSG